ncbi:MAG: hypothetical protein AAB865_00650 [Patescibacteria group bacterium]
MAKEYINTEIDGCTVELSPIIGDLSAGVLHLLPGGSENPEWYGGAIRDIYGFFATEKDTLRGGHYHPVLDELFFTLSGTALWILSDFRSDSKTKGKTMALILGWQAPEKTCGTPSYTVQETQSLARLRVPAGVYHAIAPLSTDGFTAVAIGTTPYDKSDYRYPPIDEVPGMDETLKQFGITIK